MAKRKAKSPFKKGRRKGGSTSGGGGESIFLPFREGDRKTIVPLVGLSDLVNCDMHEYWDIRPAFFHPCIGPGDACPGCRIPDGNDFSTKPRFKGYMPVVLLEDGGKTRTFKIWAFTIKVYDILEGVEDAQDDDTLRGKVLKVSRKGTSFDTTYAAVPTGKSIKESELEEFEIPDEQIEALLGPYTEETILDLLEEKGWTFDGSDDADDDGDDDDGWGEV